MALCNKRGSKHIVRLTTVRHCFRPSHSKSRKSENLITQRNQTLDSSSRHPFLFHLVAPSIYFQFLLAREGQTRQFVAVFISAHLTHSSIIIIMSKKKQRLQAAKRAAKRKEESDSSSEDEEQNYGEAVDAIVQSEDEEEHQEHLEKAQAESGSSDNDNDSDDDDDVDDDDADEEEVDVAAALFQSSKPREQVRDESTSDDDDDDEEVDEDASKPKSTLKNNNNNNNNISVMNELSTSEPYTFDLRNMLAISTDQLAPSSLYKKNKVSDANVISIPLQPGGLTTNEDFLLQQATSGCTQLIQALWQLPTEQSDAGPLVTLPSYDEIRLPRALVRTS
jgi:hypothetical protein